MPFSLDVSNSVSYMGKIIGRWSTHVQGSWPIPDGHIMIRDKQNVFNDMVMPLCLSISNANSDGLSLSTFKLYQTFALPHSPLPSQLLHNVYFITMTPIPELLDLWIISCDPLSFTPLQTCYSAYCMHSLIGIMHFCVSLVTEQRQLYLI